MTGCKHKLGFLSLKNCNLPADTTCSVCNRPICGKHANIFNDENLCVECFIEKNQDLNEEEGKYAASVKRHHIYRDTGYTGVYAGAYTYQDADYDTFDMDVAAAFDVDDVLDSDMFQDS